MELKFIEDTKHRVVFDIIGATHSLANALKKELWADSNVKIAAYNVEHPLIGIPRIIVESKADARKALLDAIDRLKKQNKDLVSKFDKALKK